MEKQRHLEGVRVKSFFSSPMSSGGAAVFSSPDASSAYADSAVGSRARVALYDAPCAAPRVEEVCPGPALVFIEALSDKVYDMAKRAGGSIPYTVIREVTENFIHADFAEPVVSILDEGNTIRFADQGPGICDKQRALLPGFTTAKAHMKEVIRGVGSGLPIVSDFLAVGGGAVVIEDNLGTGTVVTLRAKALQPQQVSSATSSLRALPSEEVLPGMGRAAEETKRPRPRLSNRQKQVLALVLDNGEAGPSLVHRELNVGLSTAHRDLACLEEAGLIRSEGGKRTLTAEGMSYLSSPSSL